MGWSSPSITDFSSPTDDAVSTPTMAVSTPLYDAAAFSTPTFWGAGGGGGDAFITALQAEPGLYGFWSARDSAVGGLATGNDVMTDLSGSGHPSLKAVMAIDGNWVIDDAAPPSTVASLSKYAETTIAADTGSYAALDSALPGFDPLEYNGPVPAPFTGPNTFSGFILYSTPNYTANGQLQEMATFFGTTGVPDVGSTGALTLFLHYYNFPWVATKGVGNSDPTYGGTTPGIQPRFDNGGGATATDPPANTWWFVGYRGFSTTAVPASRQQQVDAVTMYVQQLGSAWGAAGTYDTFTLSNYGLWLANSYYMNGLRLGYRSESSASAGARWGGVGMYLGDIGLAGLQNIFAAIP